MPSSRIVSGYSTRIRSLSPLSTDAGEATGSYPYLISAVRQPAIPTIPEVSASIGGVVLLNRPVVSVAEVRALEDELRGNTSGEEVVLDSLAQMLPLTSEELEAGTDFTRYRI